MWELNPLPPDHLLYFATSPFFVPLAFFFSDKGKPESAGPIGSTQQAQQQSVMNLGIAQSSSLSSTSLSSRKSSKTAGESASGGGGARVMGFGSAMGGKKDSFAPPAPPSNGAAFGISFSHQISFFSASIFYFHCFFLTKK